MKPARLQPNDRRAGAQIGAKDNGFHRHAVVWVNYARLIILIARANCCKHEYRGRPVNARTRKGRKKSCRVRLPIYVPSVRMHSGLQPGRQMSKPSCGAPCKPSTHGSPIPLFGLRSCAYREVYEPSNDTRGYWLQESSPLAREGRVCTSQTTVLKSKVKNCIQTHLLLSGER